MSDPYEVPGPTPPARVSRVWWFVAMFAVGFVTVLGVVYVRAPRAFQVVEPVGYVRLPESSAGGGDMTAAETARFLGIGPVDGYERGLLRSYGRPDGQPLRAVLVLVAETSSRSRAKALYDSTVTALGKRGTSFATPAGFAGYLDPPDPQNRYAQRVVWQRGDRVWVVTILTPKLDLDTWEVVRLARDQAALG